MNYVLLYRSRILYRLEKYRKDHHLQKSGMAYRLGINNSGYSNIIKHSRIIQVDRKGTDKNHRYMLSSEEAKYFAEVLGTDIYGLVWGTDTEKECFVKLILLGIITNGSDTRPIQYYSDTADFVSWALKQHCLSDELRSAAIQAQVTKKYSPTLHSQLQSFFSGVYGFFCDEDMFQQFELLRGEYDPRLEKLSNLLIEQMMADYAFANCFLKKFTTVIQNKASLSDAPNVDGVLKSVLSLLNHEGQFGDIALDFGEYDYDLFIRAFNRLWEMHGDSYMEVFNKEIFQDTALEMSLKHFQDDRFDAFISSEKFLNIVSEYNTANEFLSDEAYLAKMMKTQFLHYLIDRYGVLLKMPGPERMFDYTAQSLHLTSEMAEVLGLTVQEDGHTEENDANDVAERK